VKGGPVNRRAVCGHHGEPFGGFSLSVIPSEPTDEVGPATRDLLMPEDVKSKSRFLVSLGMTDETF
jgi:hypothetical protein